MKKNPIILSVVAFMILLISYELNSELRSYTPNKLTYTGYLCDDSGNPINNQVNLTFDIYDVSSGGTSLWNSSHSNVNINNGFFSVILENIVIFGGDFDVLYLQVKVNNEILLPRQEITAVPSSISTTNWDGGIVTGDTEFSGSFKFDTTVEWLNGSDIEREDDYWSISFSDTGHEASMFIDGGTSPEIDMQSNYSSGVRLETQADGEACLRLRGAADPDDVVILEVDMPGGGGGRLILKNGYGSTIFDFNANTGELLLKNSNGETTFEVDVETGNIHYSGELIKK